jgi:hypothetical protein
LSIIFARRTFLDMDKSMMDELEAKHGYPAAAAKAAGVSHERWRNWRAGSFPEDAALRCWLALHHPRIFATFHARRAIKAVRDAA